MANGIDWFRWHHGTVNDPKFLWVARRSGQRLGDVVMTWAALLEHASQEGDRGNIVGFDLESFDCLLGLDDGATASIVHALEEKGMIHGPRLVGWEKRQPKREESDSAVSSTERSRKFRERQRDATNNNANEQTATTGNGREEKRREEEQHSVVKSVANSTQPDATQTSGAPAGKVRVPSLAAQAVKRMRDAGLQTASTANPKLLALLDAGITLEEFEEVAREAVTKHKPFAWVLATAEGRRRDAAMTEPLPPKNAGPPGHALSKDHASHDYGQSRPL